MTFQIHFMNKDWKALTTNLGKDAVPKDFGGDLPVPEVNGTLLVDFLKLFDQQFESKIIFKSKHQK